MGKSPFPNGSNNNNVVNVSLHLSDSTDQNQLYSDIAMRVEKLQFLENSGIIIGFWRNFPVWFENGMLMLSSLSNFFIIWLIAI